MHSIVSPLVRYRVVGALQERLPLKDAIALDRRVFQSGQTPQQYVRKAFQLLHNLALNPALARVPMDDLVRMSDGELAAGTMIEAVQENERKRYAMLERLLREKCDDLDALGAEGPLRCRTCGSSSVVWDQKQTRGADEASTVFCSCTHCKSRWRMS